MNDTTDDAEKPARPERAGLRKGIYLLPNLVTTGALFSGFYSVIAAIDGHFVASAWAIYIAMFLDGIDGRLARMTSTSSDFGKEFDSLADMVSFGIAPAIVTYQWGVERLSEYGAAWGRLGWLAAFLYVASAAFRLARFNTNSGLQDRRFFQGLSSPAAAAGVASMVWVSTIHEIDGLVGLAAGIAITAIAGLLMVSRFRYLSFKDFGPGYRVRFGRLFMIPLVIIVIFIDPPIVVSLLLTIYALSGPVDWIIRRRGRGLPI